MLSPKVYAFILYRWLGWKKNVTEDIPRKCIICLAPHTSNWDFIVGQCYMRAEGMRINFLMKKEWFRGLLGKFFRSIGGIPVVRSKHTRMTDSLAETAKTLDDFRLCITPEGTRSRNPDWKHGFYYIALKANIPILLFAADYEKKLIQCTKTIIPDGDIDRQMREIKMYYKDFKGKRPELFDPGL